MNFWLGSSLGSSRKGVVLEQQAVQPRRSDDGGNRPGRGPSPQGDGLPTPPPPAPEPGPEPGSSKPVTPTRHGLLSEIIPELTKLHHHFPNGVAWALTPDGIAIDGVKARGTPGEPSTVRKIWKSYGPLCASAARTEGVPVELIVATIATESSGYPNERRSEPKKRDESVGLMQTLVGTARAATGRQTLVGDDLLKPANSIDAGTAYIAGQRGSTHFDPPLVAAAYNAGSIKRDNSEANRWKLVCHPPGTGQHVDRFVAWFSDCMKVSAADDWSAKNTVPSFAAELSGRTTGPVTEHPGTTPGPGPGPSGEPQAHRNDPNFRRLHSFPHSHRRTKRRSLESSLTNPIMGQTPRALGSPTIGNTITLWRSESRL
jgi:Transglycosylase SLT domain